MASGSWVHGEVSMASARLDDSSSQWRRSMLGLSLSEPASPIANSSTILRSMSSDSLAAALALIGIVILVASLLSGRDRADRAPAGRHLPAARRSCSGPPASASSTSRSSRPRSSGSRRSAWCWCCSPTPSRWTSARSAGHRGSPLLVLGPGTLIPAALIALRGRSCSASTALAAAILGAALASTDPVMLRTLLRRSSAPARRAGAPAGERHQRRGAAAGRRARASSRLQPAERWTVRARPARRRDSSCSAPGSARWSAMSPSPCWSRCGGGSACGGTTSRSTRSASRSPRIAAAEAVGGSGFLAAFAAGVVIAALDVELCDCFLDYGEATAEMFLLFTFVAFGAWLIWSGFDVADGRTLAVRRCSRWRCGRWCCCRCSRGSGLTRAAPAHHRLVRRPRGLSSLLLILLPVFAGMPGSERLFADRLASWCCSRSCIHGAGIAVFLRKTRARADAW